MNHYVVLKANCKYRFFFFCRIPFYAQAPVARNYHPPFFFNFLLRPHQINFLFVGPPAPRIYIEGSYYINPCPHVKRVRQDFFFLLKLASVSIFTKQNL